MAATYGRIKRGRTLLIFMTALSCSITYVTFSTESAVSTQLLRLQNATTRLPPKSYNTARLQNENTLLLPRYNDTARQQNEKARLLPRYIDTDNWNFQGKLNVSPSMKQTLSGDNQLPQRNTTGSKSLFIYANMYLMSTIPELREYVNLLHDSHLPNFETKVACSKEGYSNDLLLTLGMNLSHSEDKDAVLFGLLPQIWRLGPSPQVATAASPQPGQTWIYFSTESPHRVVQMAKSTEIARLKYHVLMSYHSDSDIVIPFGYYNKLTDQSGVDHRQNITDTVARTRLISWMSSNCREVFWPRIGFVRKLKSLIQLDDYGGCGRLRCLPKRSTKCNNLMASYKFYLAVPNTECTDYITEKFWIMSLQYGVVPVVLGARKADYEKVAPPNSFIHFSDFESIKDLADYLKMLDNDTQLYMRYHEWRKHGKVVNAFPIPPKTLCGVLPHIADRPSGDVKYLGESPWYTGCRTLPSYTRPVNLIDMSHWSVWR